MLEIAYYLIIAVGLALAAAVVVLAFVMFWRGML